MGRFSTKVSHSDASAPITIITNSTPAIRFAFGSKPRAVSAALARTSIPRPTGTAVMANIARPSERISRSGAAAPMKWSIAKTTMSGSVTTLATLTTAVYEIESAVSPRAKRVTMLEVPPPGQQASITSRTASSPLSPNAVASAKPTIGSTTIWFSSPTANTFGSSTTRWKSAIVSPRPSENMMNASESGRTTSISTLPLSASSAATTGDRASRQSSTMSARMEWDSAGSKNGSARLPYCRTP